MPVTSFAMENVKSAGPSFPRVKLDHGDTWRIVCIEQGPTFEWQHRLQKPKLSPVTGEPLMVTKEKRNGEKYEDHDMEFVGTPICIGDPDVLDEKGVDPDHCPVCKAAIDNPDAFSAPERRFAIHVLKYATKAGGQVATPFSVETRVWVMSEGKFGKVAQIIAEWGGDARKVDLILGPCINAPFQNYEIKAGQRCEMLADEARVQRCVETYQENHAEDLSAFCGRKVKDRKYLLNDLEDIEAQWAKVRAAAGGQVTAPARPDVSTTLDTSMLDLLPGGSSSPAPVQQQVAAAAAETPASEASPVSPVAEAVAPTPEPAAVTVAPAHEPASTPPPTAPPTAPAAAAPAGLVFEDPGTPGGAAPAVQAVSPAPPAVAPDAGPGPAPEPAAPATAPAAAAPAGDAGASFEDLVKMLGN